MDAINAAARRALSLAAVALFLGWVALSLTAGSARLGPDRFLHATRGERVERSAWPLWAHAPVVVQRVSQEPVQPSAAMQLPAQPDRETSFSIGIADHGSAPSAPAFRAARRPTQSVIRLSGVAVPVSSPPPRPA